MGVASAPKLLTWLCLWAALGLGLDSAEAVSPAGLQRWSETWMSLEGTAVAATDMQTAARVRSGQDLRADSLFLELSAVLQSPPPNPDVRSWVVECVLEGLIEADPRLVRVLTLASSVKLAPSWDPAGRWTLPATLAALTEGHPRSARDWIDTGIWPVGDRPYLAVLGAEARMAAGDTAGAAAWAETQLQSGTWPSWTEESLEEVRVSAALAANDLTRADSLLASYGRRFSSGPWFLRTSVNLARQQGEVERADSLSWVALRSYPESALAYAWMKQQVPLGATRPGQTLDELIALLDAAEAQRGLTRFLQLAEDLRSHHSEGLQKQTELRAAQLAYKTRRYEDLFKQLRTGRWPPSGAASPEWGQILGRAYRNTGSPDSMAVWFRQSLTQSNAKQRSGIFWEWGRELESHRRFSEAAVIYDRLLQEAPGHRANEARLRRGLCAFQSGDIAAARSSFQSLVGADTYETSMAAFWVYRCRVREGDLSAAREALEQAADERGYYAERSRVALDYADSLQIPIDRTDLFWARIDAEADDPALLEINFRDDMRAARPWQPDNAGLPASLNETAARLLLFRQYNRLRWSARALDELDRSTALGANEVRLDRLQQLGFPDLAMRRALREGLFIGEYRFPAPFGAAVTAASERWGLTPEWVWSIMRRESFFERTVHSPAGAVGLMQFMQHTADDVGSEFGLESRPLSSPQVNLQLGVAHLQQLRAEAPGRWPEILAGYNAGMHNVARWTDPNDDLDTFIEMIGYYETREYVKAVTAGYWIYRRDLRGAGVGAP